MFDDRAFRLAAAEHAPGTVDEARTTPMPRQSAASLTGFAVIALTRASCGDRFEEMRRLQVERLGNRPPMERLREEIPALRAAVTLATCCRFELHALVEPATPDAGLAAGMMRLLGMEADSFHPEPVRVLRGEEALAHWLWTALGGDSILPGETEILGQLKTAYRHAHADGHLANAALLHEVFQRGFRVVHRLRMQHLAGGDWSTSLPRLAVERMRSLWGDAPGARFEPARHLAIVGAGEVALQVAAWCLRAGLDARRLTFYVRNEERARARPGFPQQARTRLVVDLAADLAQCPPAGMFGAVTHPLHGLDNTQAWRGVAGSFPVVDLSVPAMVSPRTQAALPPGVHYCAFEELMAEQGRRAESVRLRLRQVRQAMDAAAAALAGGLAARAVRRRVRAA